MSITSSNVLYLEITNSPMIQDIEKHATMAEKKGYTVEKKLVEEAEHVQLFKGRGGEKAYWDFVTSLWDMSMEGQ